jgi:hypothetical protein
MDRGTEESSTPEPGTGMQQVICLRFTYFANY